ncbi:GSCOCT00013824001.3-RA-CDS, partial [Cotesia congregata]
MKVKSEFVVRILKIFGELLSIWPYFGSKLVVKIIQEVRWLFSTLNLILIVTPIAFGVYQDVYKNKPLNVLQRSMSMVMHLESLMNCFLWKWKDRKLKKLLLEMCDYVKSTKGRDKNIFDRLTHQCSLLYTLIAVVCTMTSISFICSPIFMSQKLLPSSAHYPFKIEPHTVRHYFLYTQQAIAILQTGLHHTIPPITIAVLLTYVIAKLKVLALKLKTIKTIDELGDWIQRHQECIKYFTLLEKTIRFVILKSFIFITTTVIFAGVLAIHSSGINEIIRLVFSVATGFIALYVYVSAADDLHELVSSMRKSIIILIRRTQKPLAISVKGIIPALTRIFYASVRSRSTDFN